jgi:hypothetical protein
MSAFILSLCCSVCRQKPCIGLIPRPKSPTDVLKLRNWSKTKIFRDVLCPIVEATGNEYIEVVSTICGALSSKSLTAERRGFMPITPKIIFWVWFRTSYVYLSFSDLNIYLFIHDSTALCWALTAFSVSWFYTQSVGLFGRGIRPSQGRFLHTGQPRRIINVHRYQCFQWDSNPRIQYSKERKYFVR